MATYKEMLLSIVNKGIDPPLEMQYGGGLDDAYMDMSRRRSNAFADPDANTAFASPMSQGGLPTIYRQNAGGTTVPKERMINNQPHQLSYINPEEAGLLKALGGSGRRVDGVPSYFWSGDESGYATGGEEGFADTDTYSEDGSYTQSQLDALSDVETKASPSLESLVDQDIIGYNEAFGPGERVGTEWHPSILRNMLEAERGDRSELRGEYPNWYSARGAPTLDQRSVRSLSQADRDKTQDLISDDKMYGLGVPIANMLEEQYGTKTFQKGLRSPLESYSQGSAIDRDDPSYNIHDEAPEIVQRFAIEFRDAKPGETMQQFADRFKEETGQEAPVEYFGFDRNSARDMNKNVQDVTEAMNRNSWAGLGQGALLFGSLLSGGLAANNLTREFRGGYDAQGRPDSSTFLGRFGDKIEGGLSELVGKGKEAIFGPGESDFSKAERAAYAAKGISEKEYTDALQFAIDNKIAISDFATMPINGKQQPTLEEVNKVDVSGSNISVMDVISAVDDPLSALANKVTSGRPTLYSDIAREREAAAKEVPTETKEASSAAQEALEKQAAIQNQQIYSTMDEVYKANNALTNFRNTLPKDENTWTKEQKAIEQRLNDKFENVYDNKLPNRNLSMGSLAPDPKETTKEVPASTNILKEIVTSAIDAGGNFASGVVEVVEDFIGSILGGGGGAAIPDESINLGPNDNTGLRQLQKKPTNQQVAAIVKEVAKTPEKVQQTLLAKGLLYQYLALIRSGYTADEAMQAVGAEAGTPLGTSAETVLV